MSRLVIGDWFLVCIMVLQMLAVLSYVWKRQWLDAVVYCCYMIAQGALILMSIKGRG